MTSSFQVRTGEVLAGCDDPGDCLPQVRPDSLHPFLGRHRPAAPHGWAGWLPITVNEWPGWAAHHASSVSNVYIRPSAPSNVHVTAGSLTGEYVVLPGAGTIRCPPHPATARTTNPATTSRFTPVPRPACRACP